MFEPENDEMREEKTRISATDFARYWYMTVPRFRTVSEFPEQVAVKNV